MRNLMLRAVAVAALATAPTFVLAQGGPGGGPGAAGGPGLDRGPGGADRGPGHGDRERGGPREDRHADEGSRGADRDRGRADRDHADRDHFDRDRDRADRDRGFDRDRDRVRVDERERGRDERIRGDRDNVRVDERVTRDRREVERVGRPGPRRVTVEERGRFHERIGRLGGERLRGGDFDVRVGGRLPDRYRFERLPPELVEVAPEYRDYDYVRVDERVLILDPETREIVDVID